MRYQDQLKEEMKMEIDDQTFQFPAERIAHTLAPKSPKGKVTEDVRSGKVLLDLSDYDIAVDPVEICRGVKLPTYKRPPGKVEERDFYSPMCTFLNECLKACKANLKREGKVKDGWLWDLRFNVWDKPMNERVGHAHALRPDIAGVNRTAELDDCYWFFYVDVEDKPSMKIVGEVKLKTWAELVAQAATYARAMFSASPLRTFCIVIGHQPPTAKTSCAS